MEITSLIKEYKKLLDDLISNSAISFDDNDLYEILPENGGVYRIFEENSSWKNSLYVGETKKLHSRIYHNHLMGNRQSSTLKRKLINQVEYKDENEVKQYLKDRCSIQYVVISDSSLRQNFEHFAISILKPSFND